MIGRPPGHHAGPNGCVPSPLFWQRPDMASSGFCLLNTVAVAAAHARNKYSVQRVNESADSASTSVGSSAVFVNGHTNKSRPLRIAIVDIDIHHGNNINVYIFMFILILSLTIFIR